MSSIVPNKFPLVADPHGRRLAIVGEAPGADEELAGEPFVGASGRLLRLVLGHCGIAADACFIGNICQHRPPGNDITAFSWDGPELNYGREALTSDLARFNPHCVLVLGRTAFRFFNPDKCYGTRPTIENPDGIKIPLADCRGSIYISPLGYKTVGTFHPAYILRSFGDIAYFRLDVARAVKHSISRVFNPTLRSGNLRPTVAEVITFLSDLIGNRTPASFDIEGYSDAIGVTMLSIAPTPSTGIVIPFYLNGDHYWSEEDEVLVWQYLSRWLADPHCPKRCHNAFYETLVLGWRHQCVVDGIVDDTMMCQWEHFNELEKSLGVTASIWTEEPYYKDERKSSDTDIRLMYNFKDSAVTEESARGMRAKLSGTMLQHYELNVSLINPFTYMHLRGCRFDAGIATAHRAKASVELTELNTAIEAELGRPFNVKSTKDKQWLLYDHLGFEPYKRYGTSTKEEIILRYYAKTKNATLLKVIKAINLRTRISDIEKLTANHDGRIRTGYDLVGTVTGRLSSRDSSVTELVVTARGKAVHVDFGTNLQNVTKALRDCFVPDGPDMLFFQADLSGADAWTVAADLCALGAPLMLEDLKHGVKPSKVLLRMLEEIEAGRDPSVIARMSSADVKRETDKIVVPEGMLPDGRPADWLYTSMKRVQHGTNYDGRAETISAVIFKDSDGAIDVPVSKIELYQRLYKLRYHTDLRSQWMREQLGKTGCIVTAMGNRRKFFGIRNPRMIDDEIIRQALASEPQTNTTGATNLALSKLWNDPENRRKSGALFIEPLLQIHDALAGQFPARLKDFALNKIREYFNNRLVIHGIEVTIPVEIKTGSSWGGCK